MVVVGGQSVSNFLYEQTTLMRLTRWANNKHWHAELPSFFNFLPLFRSLTIKIDDSTLRQVNISSIGNEKEEYVTGCTSPPSPQVLEVESYSKQTVLLEMNLHCSEGLDDIPHET